MDGERRVKGVHLANVFRFVKWKRGILGVKRFLDEWHSRPERRKIDENTFVDKDWYDYELYLELLRTADKTVGNGDMSKIYEVGYWNIKNLGHLSYLARAPDIGKFLGNAQNSWNQVYDFGSVEVEESDKKIVIRYSGFPQAPEKCQYFRGSLAGMMEICGLHGTVEERTCNTKGGEFCEFVLSW